MSYILTSYALRVPGLNMGERLLLAKLGDIANNDTFCEHEGIAYGECWPSEPYLARTMGVSTRSLSTYIASLARKGLVAKVGKKLKSTLYRLSIPTKVENISMENFSSQESDTRKDFHPTLENISTQTRKNFQSTLENFSTKPISNNQEKKKEDEASKAEVIEPKASTYQEDAAACRPKENNLMRAVARDAFARLRGKGYTTDQVKQMLLAVKDEFIRKAKAMKAGGELNSKTNPKGYLVGMLVGMAIEGPKQMPSPDIGIDLGGKPEPRDLFDILELLRDAALKDAKQRFPDLDPMDAGRIRDCYDPDVLSRQKHNMWIKLTEKQALNWYGEKSPVAAVKRMLGLEFIVPALLEKIEAERYKFAKEKIPVFQSRIARLEKDLAGQKKPDPKEPGAGYLLSFWRDLEDMRRKLPLFEARVAEFEEKHKEAV